MTQPFTEHDLDHQALKVQVHALQQLVLRLLLEVASSGEASAPQATAARARALLGQWMASLATAPKYPHLLHEAEQALIDDVALDVLRDLETHLQFIVDGAL